MTIRLNGEATPLDAPETIAALVERLGYSGKFAVALNGELVPQRTYGAAIVRPGDEVEIVAPMRGG
jgi:sulfur carrier protein